MTYPETVSYLFSLLPTYHRVGKPAYKGNLDNTLELDAYFGHPHRQFRTIHVAGTNGKGSVAHMIASVMQEAGFRTGLYTSPHLIDFRERIRIDGQMISEEEVVEFVAAHGGLIRTMKPSFFELTVALAFDYFARMKVDLAVVEVGMGGRLDSTNIITPELSVITNIGHDHMEFLGDTLAAVAGEKAGIIKHGVPVIIGETQPEISDLFVARAEAENAPVWFADRLFRCSLGRFSVNSAMRRFTLKHLRYGAMMRCFAPGDLSDGTVMRPSALMDLRDGGVMRPSVLKDLRDGGVMRPSVLKDLRDGGVIRGETPLGGLAQQRNIQTVAAAVEALSAGFGISREHFIKGVSGVVANTGLMGRWQVLSRSPLTVCDTGHNREGLEYVIRQIRATPKHKLHMVIGFVNDKDLTTVLPLFPHEAFYYFTKASVPRALDEKLLMTEAAKYGLTGSCYKSVSAAVEAARCSAGPEDMIFIGGSTFIVADAL